MNILHISSASTWRGGERQVQYLMEGLEPRGCHNYLMTPANSVLSQRSNLNQSQILEFKKGIFSVLENAITLKKYCIANRIDMIHGHDSHAHTLLWMAYRFGQLQTKSVVTRRLINPIKNRSSKKYNYPKIEKIICISEAVKKALAPSIRDASRLEVIYSSIKTATKISPKSGIKKNEFLIGYVAAFTEEKDHKTFVSTANHLIEHHPETNFKFILIGDGPLLESIKEEAETIKDKIRFTGFIEEVDQVYLQMDLLLHTSKSEALGTSILDAMKFGIPVIASNIGGIPEIVVNGENGYLCDSGDFEKMANQINNIASDSKLYNMLSSNCQESISQFDVTKKVDKTFQLYSNLIK